MKKFLAILCIALAAPAWAQTPAKYALVIGNGAYTHVAALANPVNDANDMAAALQGLGFTVDKVLDGDLARMEEAVTTLKTRLASSENSYGFFFYAGHGVQAAGENYLIPVDSDIQGENYLRQRAVSVQTVLDELNSAGNELNVVILDACRDNPFRWAAGRGGARGLNVITNPPADSIIVYSTGAGQSAADGTGRNSPFTGPLLTHLKTPGLEITEVIRRTGAAVAEASGRRQIPAVYNQFFGTAYLAGLPAPGVQPARVTPAVQLPRRPVSITYTGKLPAMKHSQEVTSVAWSPDGRYIASGSEDKTIKLWDAATGRELRTFTFPEHSLPVFSVAWSPDSKFIASGYGNAPIIQLWDAASGSLNRTLFCASDGITSLMFSPDGKHIASIHGRYGITLYDIEKGLSIWSLDDDCSEYEYSLAFSPDGKYIASGSEDGILKLLDAATGRKIRSFTGHSDDVDSVAFSPDGKYIASGSSDGIIKLWDAATGRELKTIAGHYLNVLSVAFSPDGKYIASGSPDVNIKLWDTATGRELRTFEGHSEKVNSVAFSPDGRYIVSGSGSGSSSGSTDTTVRIWDAATGEQM